MNGDINVVAIDGPSASGKSTVARRVARELGWNYVDSGAMYRGLTWTCYRAGVDVKDAAAVMALLARQVWTLVDDGAGAVTFEIDGVRYTQELRSEPVRERVSDIAAIPGVREFMVRQFRRSAGLGPLVMEGRDIGTVVFPDTRHKFYLDASPEERARRRLGDILELEGRGDVAHVKSSLERRDQKDSSRSVAPLKRAADAEVIDSTGMSIDQVVAHIVSRVRAGTEGGGR